MKSWVVNISIASTSPYWHVFGPRYMSTMATNKVESEDSDVKKAPRIYTFNDLSENVCLGIAKFWVPEERLAYQRINQMVGICCNSLWIQQKKLPRRLRGNPYYKCCLRSPNLREIDMDRMRVDPVLIFEKCPRIESFEGTLTSLIQYVTIHKEQNCIKSITVTKFEEGRSFQDLTPVKEEIKSGMKLLAENLIHLETIEWSHKIFNNENFYNIEREIFDGSQEYLKELGQRASTIIYWGSSYRQIYEKFKPGSNLLELTCDWRFEGLPQELPERHPNLRTLYYVKMSLDSFRILNGLQFLESVDLCFYGRITTTADNVLEMFRSFLLRHIHLKRLKVLYGGTQVFKQMVEDICRIRPTIEILYLVAGNLHAERDNIFTALLTLRNLREFELLANQKRGECFTFAQVTQLLAVCPKLKKVIFRPIFIDRMCLRTAEMKELIAEHEVQGRQYREEHPNRKVKLIFDLPKPFSRKLFEWICGVIMLTIINKVTINW